jgi:hypothetical protein
VKHTSYIQLTFMNHSFWKHLLKCKELICKVTSATEHLDRLIFSFVLMHRTSCTFATWKLKGHLYTSVLRSIILLTKKYVIWLSPVDYYTMQDYNMVLPISYGWLWSDREQMGSQYGTAYILWVIVKWLGANGMQKETTVENQRKGTGDRISTET